MPHEPCPPLPIEFNPEEAKPTVTLGIDFTPLNHESLRYSGFHLGHRAGGLGVDVRGRAMTAVHYEGTLVHSRLGGADEVAVVRAACPGCVDLIAERCQDGRVHRWVHSREKMNGW